MNKLDKQYTDLLQDILDNGVQNKTEQAQEQSQYSEDKYVTI